MSTHHRAARLGHRHAGADRRGHRFLDQEHVARAGLLGRFLDRAALDLGRAAGHAHQHARARPQEARLVHLADEVLEHLLGVGEVGDDAVLHRPDRGDVAGRAAEHPLGLGADRRDRARAADHAVLAHRDHRRLVEHDALAAHVDQGVGRAQVDGQVVGEHAAELLEHRGSGSVRGAKGELGSVASRSDRVRAGARKGLASLATRHTGTRQPRIAAATHEVANDAAKTAVAAGLAASRQPLARAAARRRSHARPDGARGLPCLR